jgi:aminopeptidase N
MLRNKLGDELFWSGMRLYYEKYRNKNALTNDFKTVMENTSGKNLDTFFKQWLFETGEPELKIGTTPGKSKGTTDLVIEQTQDHLFNFDIEVEILDSDGKHLYKIPVSERITRKILSAEKIIEVIPDPNTNLLFRMIRDQN